MSSFESTIATLVRHADIIDLLLRALKSGARKDLLMQAIQESMVVKKTTKDMLPRNEGDA